MYIHDSLLCSAPVSYTSGSGIVWLYYVVFKKISLEQTKEKKSLEPSNRSRVQLIVFQPVPQLPAFSVLLSAQVLALCVRSSTVWLH